MRSVRRVSQSRVGASVPPRPSFFARWFRLAPFSRQKKQLSPEELSLLRKAFEKGHLHDPNKIPEDVKQKFGEEKLADALHRFQQEHKGAKVHGTFERFMQNMEASEKKWRDYDEDEDEEKKGKGRLNVPFWAAMLVLLIVASQHIWERQESELRRHPKDQMWSSATVQRLAMIPTRTLSQMWGWLTGVAFPPSVQVYINRFYAWGTSCKLEEATKDVSEYQTLKQFFQRRLKDGLRPTDPNAMLISPVDGKVVTYGFVDELTGTIEQVKGVDYSLSDFLGPDSPVHDVIKRMKVRKDPSKNLYYCVLYLAPGDYHGYHSPANVTFTSRIHYPGHLFPVAAWAVRYLRDLFPLNERVVLSGTWEHGFFAYAPVGAYNVGSIELEFEPDLVTNRKDQTALSPPSYLTYSPPVQLATGDTVGFFNLGSSIVMVFEAPHLLFKVAPGEKVQLGQALTVPLTPALAREQLKRLEARHADVSETHRALLEQTQKEAQLLNDFLKWRTKREEN